MFAKNKGYSYKQPFALSGEVGIGANPVEGMLVLDSDQERPFASRVLLQTLQESHFSVPVTSSDPKVPLLPQHSYETDVVPVNDGCLKDYNARAEASLALDPELYYGLQFRIHYEINTNPERYFYIEIEPVLYFRGAASPKWREYKRSYAGDYFAAIFTKALQKNFQKIKPGEELKAP